MAKSFFELLKTKKENSPQVPGSTKGSAVESVAVKSEKKSSQEKPSDKKEKIFKQEELSPEEEGQLTIDVYQTERDIVIKSPVAGVRPEDLDVEIGNDMITIRGKRENEEKVEKDDYFFQELYWGSFSRSVILPTEVEADQAQAILRNGILTIRLPKVAKTKTKKIEIKVE